MSSLHVPLMSRSGIDVELTSDKCLLDPVLRDVRSPGLLSLSMSEGGGGRVTDSQTAAFIHACNMAAPRQQMME